MSRYRQTWPLDDPIQEDGDNGFLGFNSRENPETLPSGILTFAQNMRFDRGTAQVRKGLKWLGDQLSGVMTSGEKIFASCAYYDQTNKRNYIAMACQTRALLYDVVNDITLAIPYPTDANGMDEDVDTQSEIDALGLTQETVSASDQVGMVQLFNRLYIFRGENKAPMQCEVPSGSAFQLVSHASLNFQLDRAIYSDPLNVPNSDFAVAAFNRLIAPVSRDQVGFSDILDPFHFDIRNNFYVNQGDNDSIVALTPFSEGQLIVFKRNSIHLITNVYNLDASATYEITRQLGCVSRRSVASVGDQVFFLSDNGVHGLTTGINADASTSTPVALLKTRNDPLSAPIQDIIENINFDAAQKAVGIYFNNRYYLAVPYGSSQTTNNRVLVYNTLNKQWESIDSFPSDVEIDDLLITDYNNDKRLFATSTAGRIMLFEEEEEDDDNSGTDTQIQGQVTTRRYTLQTSDIKRWHYGIANWENRSSSDTLSLAVQTTNPDSTETIISNQTASGAGDLTKRFSLGRKRGYGIQLDLTTTAGRPIIRTLGVSGRVNLRSYKELT